MSDIQTQGEFILYQTDDGLAQINLHTKDGTVWVTQDDIANLFERSRSTVVEHMQNILSDGELEESSVCRKFRQTASDGKSYDVTHYNLDMILAVGYRVRSPRGVQFRKWANTILKEYLIKGFAMDDARLKQVETWDYFDEWLERIRDIRASEKRFYQKVKDLFTTAVDYDGTSDEARLFFKKVQNKMLFATTGHTASELMALRADASKPNMGLTSWKGSIVRKGDIGTAKNYLNQDEIDELNRFVTMYLDYAEDQAKRRKTITMAQWLEKLDSFLEFNDRDILTNAGKVSMAQAKKLVSERYEDFDAKRKAQEALEADEADIAELEALEKQLTKGSK